MPPKGAKKGKEPEPAQVAPAPVAESSDEPQQIIVPGANEWDAPRIYIKPKEQQQLSEKDLNNEITKVLQAQNPDAPHNIIQFSHKERVYKATAQVDQTRVHYGRVRATPASAHAPPRRCSSHSAMPTRCIAHGHAR